MEPPLTAHPSLLDRLADFLFPPRCVGCARRDRWLCPACSATLALLPAARCRRCAVPLTGALVCPRCYREPPRFEQIICRHPYEGPVRDLVHRLKYRRARHLVGTLVSLIVDDVAALPRPDVVVPVPLHPARARQRGFNQAALLASAIGDALNVRVDAAALERTRDTPSQVSLPFDQRRANVRGAFAGRGNTRGLTVLLVDDVCTTGSTLDACALALRRAGAVSVTAVVIARVLPGRPR